MTILYVNGDSHTAAAEAVNPYAFAEDDHTLAYMRRLPHPANLDISWGKRLSQPLKAVFKCDAESAASNTRIWRTTWQFAESMAKNTHELLMVIQWSTWEREEWLYNGTYYQVNASGLDHVPDDLRDQYREYIASVDWNEKRDKWHQRIWNLHERLDDLKIRHVFFNGNNHFGDIPESARRDWGISYIGPYNPKMTYHQWLTDNGFETVAANSWHFGKEAHAAWSRFMLQYIIKNNLI